MNDAEIVAEAERLMFIRKLHSKVTDGQVYLDSVRGSKFFKNHWPTESKRRRIGVIESNHMQAWSNLTDRKMYLPPWAQCDIIILHEQAHFCAGVAHGKKFRDTLAVLLGRFVGDDAVRCFKYACKACGA